MHCVTEEKEGRFSKRASTALEISIQWKEMIGSPSGIVHFSKQFPLSSDIFYILLTLGLIAL